jgi:hypothetical protein
VCDRLVHALGGVVAPGIVVGTVSIGPAIACRWNIARPCILRIVPVAPVAASATASASASAAAGVSGAFAGLAIAGFARSVFVTFFRSFARIGVFIAAMGLCFAVFTGRSGVNGFVAAIAVIPAAATAPAPAPAAQAHTPPRVG